ncbi:MAG TPA: hypothetical protein VFB96_00430 [Pirellulaceae bacterium]|nr:hypothetical protein [Pirellulaceae bacterium]
MLLDLDGGKFLEGVVELVRVAAKVKILVAVDPIRVDAALSLATSNRPGQSV